MKNFQEVHRLSWKFINLLCINVRVPNYFSSISFLHIKSMFLRCGYRNYFILLHRIWSNVYTNADVEFQKKNPQSLLANVHQNLIMNQARQQSSDISRDSDQCSWWQIRQFSFFLCQAKSPSGLYRLTTACHYKFPVFARYKSIHLRVIIKGMVDWEKLHECENV